MNIQFDLNFKPAYYWGPSNLETHYGARIKGQLRRQMVVDALDKEAMPAVLKEGKIKNSIKFKEILSLL